MPDMLGFCQWLEQSSLGSEIRDSFWLFPLIETIHLFGIVVLVGATSTLDLRLLGLAMKRDPVSKLARQMLGWTWVAFSVMVLTGFLMFSSEATRCWENTAFRLKMGMLLLAGLNALIFHTASYRRLQQWDTSPHVPAGAKIAGAFSVLLWFGIVAAGRWIAFV